MPTGHAPAHAAVAPVVLEKYPALQVVQCVPGLLSWSTFPAGHCVHGVPSSPSHSEPLAQQEDGEFTVLALQRIGSTAVPPASPAHVARQRAPCGIALVVGHEPSVPPAGAANPVHTGWQFAMARNPLPVCHPSDVNCTNIVVDRLPSTGSGSAEPVRRARRVAAAELPS